MRMAAERRNRLPRTRIRVPRHSPAVGTSLLARGKAARIRVAHVGERGPSGNTRALLRSRGPSLAARSPLDHGCDFTDAHRVGWRRLRVLRGTSSRVGPMQARAFGRPPVGVLKFLLLMDAFYIRAKAESSVAPWAVGLRLAMRRTPVGGGRWTRVATNQAHAHPLAYRLGHTRSRYKF
jgi:hypothetical protein